MRILADLHLHSRFSYATSRTLSLTELARAASAKGIGLLATGDATHPGWLAELEERLAPAEKGLFLLRREFRPAGLPATLDPEVRFLLQSEISCVFREGGRGRRVHLLLYFPSFGDARRFSAALSGRANVASDGRPTAGIPAKDLFALFLDLVPGGALVPAHLWTPWYSLLGEKSGFDSPEECFGELTGLIPAVETGLSSDPAMCRRVGFLDGMGLISNSDAHSAGMVGREANEFDLEPSFGALFESLRPGDGRFLSTVEFFPQAGKYHASGHRGCGYHTTGNRKICPVCGKPLTGGVAARIEALATREAGAPDRPYVTLLPLAELVAGVARVSAKSRGVAAQCARLVAELGPELSILRDVKTGDIAAAHTPELARAVEAVRDGRVGVEEGYDGLYGKITPG